MTYNQHRANIRNAMCGLTLTEAREFLAGAAERAEAATVEYAEEWIRELEEEIAACVDPSECSGESFCGACTD